MMRTTIEAAIGAVIVLAVLFAFILSENCKIEGPVGSPAWRLCMTMEDLP